MRTSGFAEEFCHDCFKQRPDVLLELFLGQRDAQLRQHLGQRRVDVTDYLRNFIDIVQLTPDR